MRRMFLCTLIFAFLVANNVALGLSGRCGGKIIQKGVSKLYLINKCGEPDHVETYTIGSRTSSTTGESLYYYDRSKTWIIDIRGGKVTKIKTEKR